MKLDELVSAPVGHRLDAAGVAWVKCADGWGVEGEEGLDLPVTAPELLWYVRRYEAGERWWLAVGELLVEGPMQRRPTADHAAFRRLSIHFGQGVGDLAVVEREV